MNHRSQPLVWVQNLALGDVQQRVVGGRGMTSLRPRSRRLKVAAGTPEVVEGAVVKVVMMVVMDDRGFGRLVLVVSGISRSGHGSIRIKTWRSAWAVRLHRANSVH